MDLIQFLRIGIMVLAFLSACMFIFRRQWENMITRLMTAILFASIIIDVGFDNATINFLIRWIWFTYLFVELLSWCIREKILPRLWKYVVEKMHGLR